MNTYYEANQIHENRIHTTGSYEKRTTMPCGRQEKMTQAQNAAAYYVQFDGAAWGNQAYQAGAGKELSGIDSSSPALLSMRSQTDYQILMSATVSDEEFGRLLREGYQPGEMTPEEIVTVVDEIKAKMAEAGVVVSGYNDDLSEEDLQQIVGNTVNVNQILEAMRNCNLPVTADNVQEIADTVRLAEGMEGLSEGSKKYLLENGLEPSYENLYLAVHSGARKPQIQAKGYFEEGNGYYGKKPEAVDFSSLQKQIDQILQQAGYEITQENRQDAAWLIENGMPLTQESLHALKKLNQIVFPLEAGETAKAAAIAIKNEKRAADGIPGQAETYEQQAKKLLEKFADVSKAAVCRVLSESQPVHLQNLMRAQLEIQIEKTGSGDSFADRKVDQTMALLQEVRLKMTTASAAYLLRSGISVDTTELSCLVEELKTAENNRNRILFGKPTAEENQAAAGIFEQTNQKVMDLKQLPAALTGKLVGRSVQNLNVAFEQGVLLKNAYEAAGEKYEPLLTAPRADLGDSMQKAFRNIDELLQQNGMEGTETNRKAVRILAYNQMEITPESIRHTGEVYERLTDVIARMTPGKVLSMIRQNRNPLDTDLEKLEQYLENEEEDVAAKAENYSHFLVRLQEKKEISETEKEAYIGIYRLFYQIEKKDSAAIGAVLKEGREVTLGKLLENVRNSRWQGRDFKIDDSFGLLDTVLQKGTSITEQIAGAFAHAPVREELTGDMIFNEPASELLKFTNSEFTLNQMKAAGVLVNSRGRFYKTVSYAQSLREDAPQSGLTEEADSFLEAADAQMQDKIRTFEQETELLQEHFTAEGTAKDAFLAMTERMQTLLEESSEKTTNPADLKNIAQALKQLPLLRKMAARESYEIPMRFGEEITSVNVHFIHDAQKRSSVTIYSESELFGRFRVSFEMQENGLNGLFAAADEEALKHLEERSRSLPEQLLEKGIRLEKMNFLQSDSLQVNFGTGKADVNNRKEAETGKVSTKMLYETAQVFLKLLA